MKHPITNNILTHGTLYNRWITAKEACAHIGLNGSDPSQRALVQYMVDKGVIPEFDFVHQHQEYRFVFKWDSIGRIGHEEWHRKHFSTLWITLKCYVELKNKYLEDIKQSQHLFLPPENNPE
jgi:hypothetical protein